MSGYCLTHGLAIHCSSLRDVFGDCFRSVHRDLTHDTVPQNECPRFNHISICKRWSSFQFSLLKDASINNLLCTSLSTNIWRILVIKPLCQKLHIFQVLIENADYFNSKCHYKNFMLSLLYIFTNTLYYIGATEVPTLHIINLSYFCQLL